MTEDKNTTIISGFSFSDPATIELARKEESAVTYLKGQIDYQKPDAVLSMYQKLVHKKVFRTAVGMTFLHEHLWIPYMRIHLFRMEANF